MLLGDVPYFSPDLKLTTTCRTDKHLLQPQSLPQKAFALQKIEEVFVRIFYSDEYLLFEWGQ